MSREASLPPLQAQPEQLAAMPIPSHLREAMLPMLRKAWYLCSPPAGDNARPRLMHNNGEVTQVR